MDGREKQKMILKICIRVGRASVCSSRNSTFSHLHLFIYTTAAQGYNYNLCVCPMCSWGRWKDILSHGRFKRALHERDVEMICRALLAYCLLHYRGDENIKSFIWDLITPTEDGQSKTLTNHSGTYTHSFLGMVYQTLM